MPCTVETAGDNYMRLSLYCSKLCFHEAMPIVYDALCMKLLAIIIGILITIIV